MKNPWDNCVVPAYAMVKTVDKEFRAPDDYESFKEIADYIQEVAPLCRNGVAPYVDYPCYDDSLECVRVSYHRDLTPEELDKAKKHIWDAQQVTEKHEREQYLRLAKKFGAYKEDNFL